MIYSSNMRLSAKSSKQSHMTYKFIISGDGNVLAVTQEGRQCGLRSVIVLD